MFKKLNFTKRKRLKWRGDRTDFSIPEVYNIKGEDPHFIIRFTDMPTLDLSLDKHKVDLEYYYSTFLQSYDLGIVGDIRGKEIKKDLKHIPQKKIQFRIKIINPQNFSISARSDRIIPEFLSDDEDQNEKIIQQSTSAFFNLVIGDIDTPWQVELSPGEKPKIVCNKKIFFKNELLNDAKIKNTHLPKIFKEVLLIYLTIDEDYIPHDDHFRMYTLKIAEDWAGKINEGNRPDDYSSIQVDQEVLEWIDNAVGAFCTQHRFIENFQKIIEQQES